MSLYPCRFLPLLHRSGCTFSGSVLFHLAVMTNSPPPSIPSPFPVPSPLISPCQHPFSLRSHCFSLFFCWKQYTPSPSCLSFLHHHICLLTSCHHHLLLIRSGDGYSSLHQSSNLKARPADFIHQVSLVRVNLHQMHSFGNSGGALGTWQKSSHFGLKTFKTSVCLPVREDLMEASPIVTA